MIIKNKWKIFSLSQILSDWTGNGVDLFDALEAAHGDGIADMIFDEYEATIWHVFEDFEPEEVSRSIYQMAKQAQETEAQQ
jgi:hypothetical protein